MGFSEFLHQCHLPPLADCQKSWLQDLLQTPRTRWSAIVGSQCLVVTQSPRELVQRERAWLPVVPILFKVTVLLLE